MATMNFADLDLATNVGPPLLRGEKGRLAFDRSNKQYVAPEHTRLEGAAQISGMCHEGQHALNLVSLQPAEHMSGTARDLNHSGSIGVLAFQIRWIELH